MRYGGPESRIEQEARRLKAARAPLQITAIEDYRYVEPAINPAWPDLWSGIDLDIYPVWPRAVFARVYANRPDASRAERGWTKRCATMQEALAFVNETLPKARAWLAMTEHPPRKCPNVNRWTRASGSACGRVLMREETTCESCRQEAR